MTVPVAQRPPIVRLRDVSLAYGPVRALDAVTLDFSVSCMAGLIGPDGVGKSSLLSLVAGTRRIQRGQVEVLGGDMARTTHRTSVCPRIAYMPQGLGKNLYPTLSVFENVDFFGRLFGLDARERKQRIDSLLADTGLAPFADRPAAKLSGGMKQKLGLCCSLIHDPDLLILDEPTTGVDPLSRRQFWELIDRLRAARPEMSVIVATAYMDEAARFDWLVAMDAARVLATGTPQELLTKTRTQSLEAAFVQLLPEQKRSGHSQVVIPPRAKQATAETAIEARDLTMRFGDFVAVDHVSFRIERGEIFGFLGSNGCGKTTTMKMLTGLLPASEGECWLFGRPVNANDLDVRRRVGYMSQSFSLYSELTVRQNLVLHARLFQVPAAEIPGRVDAMADRFGLGGILDSLPDALPLGQRQRLSLAVAMIHQPEMLILDEPTSGVDPVARDGFWRLLLDLSRRDQVTIFISTHFMNEAERCDRISLMHAGKVLVSDTPDAITRSRNSATLEEAFIADLEEASKPGGQLHSAAESASDNEAGRVATLPEGSGTPVSKSFSLRRLMSYARRETLELSRDPIRATLALVGSVILMFIMGYGITMDVEDLSFAVLDRDQTTLSRDYALNLSGSRYFREQPPIADDADLDRRMRSGELTLALELPANFARDLARGNDVEIGAWIDGAMPNRAETIRGYVQGMHQQWMTDSARRLLGQNLSAAARVETRYRYNPDVKSLVAMVPAVIPLLLMLIPAMLATLSVVREKELGSIINFYATPTTRLELLLGKQVPYVALGLLNFVLLVAIAVSIFRVPLTGSIPAFLLAAWLYVMNATAFGLLISSFVRSQIAGIFGAAVLTMLPATQFSGLLDPVSSLEGAGAVIGRIFPTTHFLTISRGIFSKGLQLSDLKYSFLALLISFPVLLAASAALLKKQDR